MPILAAPAEEKPKLDLADDRVKAYRIATVAHSRSELAVTYAVGVLDSFQLAEMDRSRVEAAVRPDITEKWAHEFNPKTRRPRYPTGHTVYWDVAAGDATDE